MILQLPEVARTVSLMVAALRHSHPHHPTTTNQIICNATRPHKKARCVPFQPKILESTAPPNPTTVTADTAEPRIKTNREPVARSTGSKPQLKHVHALLKGLLCIHDSQYQKSFIASEGLESVLNLLASTRIFISKMQAHHQRHPVPQNDCPGCAGLQALKAFAGVQLEQAAISQHTKRREALERILAQLKPQPCFHSSL